MSIFVVVCLGVALVALVRKRQNIVSMEISKLQNVRMYGCYFNTCVILFCII